MKTVCSLNRALSRKSKSGIRSESGNKGSFMSHNPSTSFQHHINLNDDNESELDERIGSIPACSSMNVSRTDDEHMNKRSMSEMSKSIAHAISVSKAPKAIPSKSKDTKKYTHQGMKMLSEVKTVSLHDNTGSTKSSGQTCSRPMFRTAKNGTLSSNNGKLFRFY